LFPEHAGVLQHGIDGLDSGPFLVLVDETAYQQRWRSGSAAKKVGAYFRISFARRSSRFSPLQLREPGGHVGRHADLCAAVGLHLGDLNRTGDCYAPDEDWRAVQVYELICIEFAIRARAELEAGPRRDEDCRAGVTRVRRWRLETDPVVTDADVSLCEGAAVGEHQPQRAPTHAIPLLPGQVGFSSRAIC
jgi:hypothetical protein